VVEDPSCRLAGRGSCYILRPGKVYCIGRAQHSLLWVLVAAERCIFHIVRMQSKYADGYVQRCQDIITLEQSQGLDPSINYPS
jgi:hypothetical protein